MYLLEEIFALQIRAGLVVGEITTLAGTGEMDRASSDHPVAAEKDTGAIGPGFEGIFPLDIAFAHLAVADIEMSGQAVDILSSDKEG